MPLGLPPADGEDDQAVFRRVGDDGARHVRGLPYGPRPGTAGRGGPLSDAGGRPGRGPTATRSRPAARWGVDAPATSNPARRPPAAGRARRVRTAARSSRGPGRRHARHRARGPTVESARVRHRQTRPRAGLHARLHARHRARSGAAGMPAAGHAAGGGSKHGRGGRTGTARTRATGRTRVTGRTRARIHGARTGTARRRMRGDGRPRVLKPGTPPARGRAERARRCTSGTWPAHGRRTTTGPLRAAACHVHLIFTGSSLPA